MARYRKIDPRMWGDEKFRRLTPIQPSGQALWLYLLTGPHNNVVPGLFSIGESGLSERLRWPLEALRKAFAEGLREELFEYDPEALVISIPKAIKYDPPANPNVVKSWSVGVDEIPECELKNKHMRGLREALISRKGFGKGFVKAFDKAFPKGFSKGLANTTTTATTTETPTTTSNLKSETPVVGIDKPKKKKIPHPGSEHLKELQELSDHHADLFERDRVKVQFNDHLRRIARVLLKYGLEGCKLIQIGHKETTVKTRFMGWEFAYPMLRDGKKKFITEPDWSWIQTHYTAGKKKNRPEDEDFVNG